MKELKILTIGAEGAGKSSIILRFAQKEWIPSYSPTIQDIYHTTLEHHNHNYTLDILDTAGHDDYSHMRDLFMKQCDGVLCIFDICDSQSFSIATQQLKRLMTYKGVRDFPIIIVGNKSDCAEQRAVSKKQAADLAKQYNTIYIEASAKLNIHITDSFVQLVTKMIRPSRMVMENVKPDISTTKPKTLSFFRDRLLSLVLNN